MKPIKQQCAERGIPVPVGKTALEIVMMGLEVSPMVQLGAVLEVDGENARVRLGEFTEKTGYAFVPVNDGMMEPTLRIMSEIAAELDKQILERLLKPGS